MIINFVSCRGQTMTAECESIKEALITRKSLLRCNPSISLAQPWVTFFSVSKVQATDHFFGQLHNVSNGSFAHSSAQSKKALIWLETQPRLWSTFSIWSCNADETAINQNASIHAAVFNRRFISELLSILRNIKRLK